MPTKHEVTVFQYDELDDKAKGVARDWYREASSGDSDFGDPITDDLVLVAQLMGIDMMTHEVRLYGGGTRQEPNVYWSGFWSQGDGACFDAYLSYKRGAIAAIKKHAPQDEELQSIVKAWQTVHAKYGYLVSGTVKHSGHYNHRFSTTFDLESEGAERYLTEAQIEEFAEVVRDLMLWFYRALEKEYDYQNSDEVVEETIQINEYEFTEDGKRYKY